MQALQETDSWDPISFHHVWLGLYSIIPRTALPELLQGGDLQTEVQLTVHTWWRCTNFFSCFSGSFTRRVYETLDRTNWTNSMAFSFPWFKSLLFSSQETSTVYCLCNKSQWCPGLAITNTEWIWGDSYDTWNIPASYAVFRRSTLKLKLDTPNIVFNFQEAGTRKPCCRGPFFIYSFRYVTV